MELDPGVKSRDVRSMVTNSYLNWGLPHTQEHKACETPSGKTNATTFPHTTMNTLARLHQTRLLALSRRPAAAAALRGRLHSTDSYNKDSDTTPPPDSKVHRVDPYSPNVQKAHEPPVQEVGVESKEYSNVDKENPYKAPGPSERYGSAGGNPAEGTPSPEEGPQGKSAHGVGPRK
jgi:hypothetical protein